MTAHLRRLTLKSHRILFLFPALLCLVPVFFTPGCGDDDGETIIITLVPWTLDFDSLNQLFLVERSSLSIWKFTGGNPSGQLLPPITGGFTPWGIDVGDAATLFVSDETLARPRLLAVSTGFTGVVPLGSDTLLAEATETLPGIPLSAPRAVESLHLVGNLFRVFVAAGSQVLVYAYDAGARNFSFQQTLTGGCGYPFQLPWGLAVDVPNQRLYVVDGGGNDRLYQFSGIDGLPVCEDEVDQWGGISFDNPTGVAVLTGQTAPEDNKIVVADTDNSRLVAFFWDGLDIQQTILPGNFVPPAGRPFDVAFDADGNLAATYP